jgi:hypothetical protein
VPGFAGEMAHVNHAQHCSWAGLSVLVFAASPSLTGAFSPAANVRASPRRGPKKLVSFHGGHFDAYTAYFQHTGPTALSAGLRTDSNGAAAPARSSTAAQVPDHHVSMVSSVTPGPAIALIERSPTSSPQ